MDTFVIGTIESKQIGQVCRGLLDEHDVFHEDISFEILEVSDELDWFTTLMATNQNSETLSVMLDVRFQHFYRVRLVKPTP